MEDEFRALRTAVWTKLAKDPFTLQATFESDEEHEAAMEALSGSRAITNALNDDSRIEPDHENRTLTFVGGVCRTLEIRARFQDIFKPFAVPKFIEPEKELSTSKSPTGKSGEKMDWVHRWDVRRDQQHEI